jgi:hypothetical protein
MRLLDLGGDTFERERTYDGRVDDPGVGGNNGPASSWNENVAWYGLSSAVLDASELRAECSLLERPFQLSLIL